MPKLVKKIAVFSGDLSYSACKGISEINNAVPDASWLIVLHAPPMRLRRLINNQWRNIRASGWRWIPYQVRDVVRRILRTNTLRASEGIPGSTFAIKALQAMPNVRVIQTQNIHSKETLQTVRDFSPDLGLSIAAPILRPALFSIPKLGTINLHKGRVPHYRGMPPAFWELWNDEQEVGCTVHQVSEKLDAGDVLLETSIARSKFSTVRGMQISLDEAGIVLMRDAVVALADGNAEPRTQEQGGRTYRKPTLRQVYALERRLRQRETPNGRLVAKRYVKKAMAAALRARTLAGLHRLCTPRITVLLYHRVTDEVRDNLTVGVEQFERQMALVREHCEPLSIEQVLGCSEIKASRRPMVAVTFDDGYLDNYLNAAPVLERHGIPSAFFVSTGIVSSGGRFPHDVRRNNPAIPVMSWVQLREMRDRGFTIGSHSVTHVDCASESESVVEAELEQSRDDLVRELGCTTPIFAYPYGGRSNMTPARLELVKEAGYVGCLSAYGGSNVRQVDPFNVLRRGIHWEFDDSAFLLECYGVL